MLYDTTAHYDRDDEGGPFVDIVDLPYRKDEPVFAETARHFKELV